jgi:RNA polymerase sigma factor (sigma-70 family)
MEASDEELMLRYRDGEDAAFELLFNRHSNTVFGFLLRMTSDRGTAEDLAQTTFTSLIRSKDRFVDGTKFKPWLFTIATNAARELHRNKQVRVRASDELQAAAESTTSEQPNFDPGLQREVNVAMTQLPSAQREAVVMHKVQGMSFDEIGEVLGVTASAARIKAHRGYARLRELLAHLKD